MTDQSPQNVLADPREAELSSPCITLEWGIGDTESFTVLEYGDVLRSTYMGDAPVWAHMAKALNVEDLSAQREPDEWGFCIYVQDERVYKVQLRRLLFDGAEALRQLAHGEQCRGGTEIVTRSSLTGAPRESCLARPVGEVILEVVLSRDDLIHLGDGLGSTLVIRKDEVLNIRKLS